MWCLRNSASYSGLSRGLQATRTRRANPLAAAARGAWRTVFGALLPLTCPGCARWVSGEDGPLCTDCASAIDDSCRLPACGRCGRLRSPLSIRTKDCAGCARERHWNIAGLVTLGPYRDVLQQLILGLKFAGAPQNADTLGQLLAEQLSRQEWIGQVDMLVPVPMHRLRRWQRPGDHARMLARAVSRVLKIPARNAAIRRHRYSMSQTRAGSRAARFENVKDCFAPARRPGVEGRTVCIVDNLVVTGATLHEVSKVLRKAGAKRIYAAIAARSTPPGEPRPNEDAFAPPLQP